MFKNPKLPLIPGFVVNTCIKHNFHRPQLWNYINGTQVRVEKDQLPLEDQRRDKIFRKATLYPPHTGPQLPDWLANDRKILCFRAYFRQELEEIYQAPYQIRQVKILFYLEDQTIQIIEPQKDNSGISQGCIVSRQRVPCPAPHDNDFITLLDLNVQQAVKIFDQTYHITDCDEFTRNYLIRAGINVPPPIEVPKDPGQVMRKQMEQALVPKKPKAPREIVDKLGQFLKFDKQCLKFDAYWDDRSSTFGHIRDLVVFYYLADDTMKIYEKFQANRDYDLPTTFLRRQRVPKMWNGMPMVGQQTNFTVLNVLGGGIMKGRYIEDNSGIGRESIEYYTDRDLKIGEVLNVFGRNIVLTDCDQFTREYYYKKYGLEHFDPIPKPQEPTQRWTSEVNERTLPPFNGWGTHEDSEQNCITFEPKAPHADLTKFIELSHFNLRFGARMLSDVKANEKRKFVITYFLSDDTISVYEKPIRNSGFKGGEFYKRSKYYLPNQNWFDSNRPKAYSSQHCYIDAEIHIQGHVFQIISADEFTLRYMETHPFEYPKSNINLIMNKIKMAIEPIYKDFVAKYLRSVTAEPCNQKDKRQQKVFICFKTMRVALRDLLGADITEHEIVTFLRHFSVESCQNRGQKCDRNVIRSLIQLELSRNLWDDVARMKEHIYHLDPDNTTGYMDERQLRSLILACRLPIKSVLIDNMLSVLKRNSCGEVEINDFLYFIDYFNYKSAPIQPMNLYDICTNDTYSEDQQQLIDWSAFINELGFEDELKAATS